MKFTTAISKEKTPFKANLWMKLYVVLFSAVWLNTLIGTNDMNNWLLENALTFIALVFLILTYRKFHFSDLSYLFISVFLCMHVYGSKYTYAENPLGYWMRDAFHLSRNHYDRLAHFSFGFLLTYPMREMLLYWLGLSRRLACFLPVEITLSIGAMYELVEWGVADVFFKEQGVAYLGTQGDGWDAQKDLFMAFSGALTASLIIWIVGLLISKYKQKEATLL